MRKEEKIRREEDEIRGGYIKQEMIVLEHGRSIDGGKD